MAKGRGRGRVGKRGKNKKNKKSKNDGGSRRKSQNPNKIPVKKNNGGCSSTGMNWRQYHSTATIHRYVQKGELI